MGGEWIAVTKPKNGSFDAVCIGATEHTSQYGNPCIEWRFNLSGQYGMHSFITPLRGSRALLSYDTVRALGLDPAATRLTGAFGKTCKVTMKDGSIVKVVKA